MVDRATARATPDASDDWVVLASARATRAGREQPVRFRRVVLQLGAAVVVVLTAVAAIGSVVSRHSAEQQGVHDAAQTTDLLAQSTIQPALTDAMLTDAALARRVLTPIVRDSLKVAAVTRVKIWTATGRILYSDDSRLIGRVFTLDGEAVSSLTVPSTVAGISDLNRPENVFEQRDRRLLEVYRPVWTPAGVPLLFEAYYPYSVVTARADDLWRGFSGILLSSLAAVFVLLLPVAWTLVARTRRAQRSREEAMQRAIDASADERRRIAATLHDGAVQQLAAASFAVAAAAERAANDGNDAEAVRLRDTAATVRTTLGGMRSLLVDIYPAGLRTAGLETALRDLASSIAADDARVLVDVDSSVAERLTADEQEAVFRVAQEALRNAAKHAHPTRVDLRLRHCGPRAQLLVADDGRGFAPGPDASPEGHFGLALMTDAASGIGAELAVSSAPGAGTRVRMEMDLS